MPTDTHLLTSAETQEYLHDCTGGSPRTQASFPSRWMLHERDGEEVPSLELELWTSNLPVKLLLLLGHTRVVFGARQAI